MTWSTLEAAGRVLEPERAATPLSPPSLADVLVSNGHPSQSEGAELRKLGKRRDALAHGQIDPAPTATEVSRAIALTEQLLRLSKD